MDTVTTTEQYGAILNQPGFNIETICDRYELVEGLKVDAVRVALKNVFKTGRGNKKLTSKMSP